MLERQAKEKKDIHIEACVEWRRSFAPRVYLVDGMAAKKTSAFENCISSLLAVNWNRNHNKIVECVRAYMALAVIRGVTLKLQGSRCRTAWPLEWLDGAASEGTLRGHCC